MSANDALKRIIEATREGEPNAIWQAYETFFTHPDRNDVDGDLFISCFRVTGCFFLDVVASVLGKSKHDVNALIDGFCPHFETWLNRKRVEHFNRGLSNEKIAEEINQTKAWLHRFSGHDQSCREWKSRIQQSLPPQRTVRSVSSTIWSLLRVNPRDFSWLPTNTRIDGEQRSDENVKWWPTVSYRIGDGVRHAVIDTGSTSLFFQNDNNIQNELFTSAYEYKVNLGVQNTTYQAEFGYIQEIHINDDAFKNIGAVQIPSHVFEDELDMIGMSLLLQYGAVCFSWNERLLYLGQLGPCSDGLKVSGALMGQGPIYIAVQTRNDKNTWNAFIDTGAVKSRCAPELIPDTNEVHLTNQTLTFHIKGRNNLTGMCHIDDAARRPMDANFSHSPSPQHVLIGLETLQTFRAFGWRHSPLTVYFLTEENIKTVD